MSNQELNSLDDFRGFVSSTITPWSREQRIALAAAMAERWLPVYESFSEQEGWGDPSTLQRAVQSVWNCALGRTLTPKDHKLHKKRVEENMPHMDDFDAEEALATSCIIDYALDCCLSADNTGEVIMAMVSGFEGVAPGIYTDAGELSPDVWNSPEVLDLIKKQLTPLMDNAPTVDEQELDAFRQELMSLPAVTDEGVGPLPWDVWHSPEVHDQMEKSVQLVKGMSNIAPMIAEQMQALQQKLGPPETNTEASRDAWQLPHVQNELEKQLKLLKLIGDMAQIDQHQIDALRQQLTSPELLASPTLRPTCSAALTNEGIFQRYRDEADGFLTNKQMWIDAMDIFGNTEGMAIPYFRAWAFRYSRRKRAIEERPMIDVIAHTALLKRYSTHDAAVQGDAGWSKDAHSCIEQGYQMDFEFDFDVHSPDKPHSYGPSLRRLYIERRLAGDSDKDVWERILDWACHRPPAWEDEDRRKKQGHAYATPELGERLTRNMSWRATDNVDQPWATEDAGETWRIRLNDFPDDLMYTLIINERIIGSFHDWPECWHR